MLSRETKNEEETDTFYDNLQSLINTTAKRDTLLISGDFNAKIGGLNSIYPNVIGHHNNRLRGHNERGIRLANFCKMNKLTICNSNTNTGVTTIASTTHTKPELAHQNEHVPRQLGVTCLQKPDCRCGQLHTSRAVYQRITFRSA